MLKNLQTPAASDPLEAFARMAEAMRRSNSANGAPTGSVMDKLITAVVERVLNPPIPPSNSGAVLGVESARVLPSLAQYVTKGIGEHARIVEARRDVAIRRGAQSGYVVPRAGAEACAITSTGARAPGLGGNGNGTRR